MSKRWKEEAIQLVSLANHYKGDLTQIKEMPEQLKNEITMLSLVEFAPVAMKYASLNLINDKTFAYAALMSNLEVFPYLPFNLLSDDDFMAEVSKISNQASDYIKEKFKISFKIDNNSEDNIESDDNTEDNTVTDNERKTLSKDAEIDFPSMDNIYVVNSQSENTKFILEGMKRWFIEPVNSERDYSLEYTTPYKLKIGDTVIANRAWSGMLVSLCNALNQTSNKCKEELIKFKEDWSNVAIFSEQGNTNSEKLDNGLYLTYDHTARHSCWLLVDLLKFYGVDLSSVVLLINRPKGSLIEPLREEITKKFKQDFEEYIKEKFPTNNLDIIDIIENKINPIQRELSPSYPDLFFFDDLNIFRNVESNLRRQITDETGNQFDERTRALRILLSYYTSERFKETYSEWYEGFIAL